MKDTFYISHGAPTLAIDKSIPARHFLQSWKDKVFPQKPKAILVISGHWDTSFPAVNIVHRNDTIYDFYGFPDSMYKVPFLTLLTFLFFFCLIRTMVDRISILTIKSKGLGKLI